MNVSNSVFYRNLCALSAVQIEFLRTTGVPRLMVTQEIVDPEYLYRAWIVTYNFKKEQDGAKWQPTPCSARW
jgi:hypothetical protein